MKGLVRCVHGFRQSSEQSGVASLGIIKLTSG